MDEKPDQIMSHIESQRDALGRNLNELETRVKSTTDWRVQFDRNPMLMVGVALGGGILLGSMVGGGRKGSTSGRSNWTSSRNYSGAGASMGASSMAGYSAGSSAGSSGLSSSPSSSSASSPAVREQRRKATDTLEHMKAALIGFATAKVKEFMTEALPGFDHHLDEAERRNQSARGGSSSYDQSGGSQSGWQSEGSAGSSQPSGSQSGYQSGGSQGTQGSEGTTRTEHSANSPYSQQSGANTGLNTPANTGLNI